MSMPTHDGVFLWQTEANCGGTDTSKFFDEEREAKKVCINCPVKSECLQDALVYNYDGVWGGTTTKERRRIKHKEFLRDDYKEAGLYNPALKV